MSERNVVVGLPVHNGQKFLSAAIESHLSQSYGDFDLVISDNASTDATADICADYAKKDSRIRILRSDQNRGALWNHRRVLEAIESPGQLFRWAGADDIIEQEFLQVMVEEMVSMRDIVAVAPATKNIDAHGAIVGTAPRSLDFQSDDVVERARNVLVANFQHVVGYGIVRASVLQSLRTGPNYIGWDSVFVWELALHGRIKQSKGPALLRRFHAGASSHAKTAKEIRKWVEPDSKAGMSFPYWTWAYERARTLGASPVSRADSWRIGMFLARYTLWQRVALLRDVTQAGRRVLGLSDEYTF